MEREEEGGGVASGGRRGRDRKQKEPTVGASAASWTAANAGPASPRARRADTSVPRDGQTCTQSLASRRPAAPNQAAAGEQGGRRGSPLLFPFSTFSHLDQQLDVHVLRLGRRAVLGLVAAAGLEVDTLKRLGRECGVSEGGGKRGGGESARLVFARGRASLRLFPSFKPNSPWCQVVEVCLRERAG